MSKNSNSNSNAKKEVQPAANSELAASLNFGNLARTTENQKSKRGDAASIEKKGKKDKRSRAGSRLSSGTKNSKRKIYKPQSIAKTTVHGNIQSQTNTMQQVFVQGAVGEENDNLNNHEQSEQMNMEQFNDDLEKHKYEIVLK